MSLNLILYTDSDLKLTRFNHQRRVFAEMNENDQKFDRKIILIDDVNFHLDGNVNRQIGKQRFIIKKPIHA